MPLSNKVIVLDFDGVVWDSVDESFEQAWLAWGQLRGKHGVDHDTARRVFREARWQCKDGYDFCIVTALLEQGRTDVGTLSPGEFRMYRETLARGADADSFVNGFYDNRERMRTADFERWCSLQRPYPGIVEQIAQIRGEARGVAVATTKDSPSARALLAHAGLGDLPVYGREVSLDKRDHMKAIADHYGVSYPDMAFVEDLPENLLHVKDLGLKLVLADWGYNTPTERARAADQGIVVVSLGDFAERLRGLWAE